MPSLNFLNSLWNLFVPCLNFITEGFCYEYADFQSSTPTSVSDLPLSVVIEVFSKLPIKSVIQCRCVCKSWYDITFDKYFTSSYFANPPYTTIALSQHGIVANGFGDKSFDFLEIGSDGDVKRTPFNPKALNFSRNGFLSIMGSCNGLLCVVQTPHFQSGGFPNQDSIYNKQTAYIINPLLGVCTTLARAKRAKNISSVIYCFGCNRNCDSYKALRLLTTFDNGHGYQVNFEILTIGVDNKWRPLDLAFATAFFPCGICLNGVIHLVGGEFPFGFILAFDIEEETPQYFPLPRGLGDEPNNIVMAVWDGKLCFADNNIDGQVDIWTMKEYGDVDSWTREIILKSWIPFELRHYRFVPIATLTNGDLLMSRENEGDVMELRLNHLMSFNQKTKECIKHEISDGGDEVAFFFFHGYTPRFFSGGLSW